MELRGSIFLDEGFVELMEGLLGKDKLSKLRPSTYDELMKIWELKMKRQFHTDNAQINAQMPHHVAKAIRSPSKIRRMRGKEIGSRSEGRLLNGDCIHFSSYVHSSPQCFDRLDC